MYDNINVYKRENAVCLEWRDNLYDIELSDFNLRLLPDEISFLSTFQAHILCRRGRREQLDFDKRCGEFLAKFRRLGIFPVDESKG